MNHYSSHDMLGLIAEINCKRMPKILGDLAKKAGGNLVLMPNERDLMMDMRRLNARFLRGDYTHSDADEDRTKVAMDWLVSTHAQLNKQEARLPELQKDKLRTKVPVKPGTYQLAIQGCGEW